MSCIICADTFNKSKRKQVTCPYCPAKICLECHKQYLMSTTEPAHCMDCRTAWSSEVCFILLPKSFQHEYSVRRAELCVAQEKNLLPETMLQIQRERIHLDMKRHTHIISTASNTLDSRVSGMIPAPNNPGVVTHDRLALIEKNIAEYKALKQEYDRLTSPGFVDQAGGVVDVDADDDHKEQFHVYLPCPYDGCKGFTGRGGTCGLCSKKVCLACRMPKNEDHTCSPDDVASVSLLKKDCKPCPKCRVMIHRYEGCPQMFCTQCHAKFSWNTGEILKDIHNPHLTEWLLNHGGRGIPEGAACGVVITYSAFPKEAHHVVDTYYNHAMHIQRYVIPSLRRSIEPIHASLRLKYLLSTIDEAGWVNEIRLYNLKSERTQEIIQVLEMFHDVVLRGLSSVHTKTSSWQDVKILLSEVTASMNSKLDGIHKQYNIVVYKYKWSPREVFDFQ